MAVVGLQCGVHCLDVGHLVWLCLVDWLLEVILLGLLVDLLVLVVWIHEAYYYRICS